MTLSVARTAAVKKPKSKPVQISVVTIEQLPAEILALLPADLDRVQIVNANTVVVWNSLAQRRRLQKVVR